MKLWINQNQDKSNFGKLEANRLILANSFMFRKIIKNKNGTDHLRVAVEQREVLLTRLDVVRHIFVQLVENQIHQLVERFSILKSDR